MSYSGEDRRNVQRFACQAPVGIIVGESGGKTAPSRTVDIGPAGARIIFRHPLPVNAQISLDIHLPHFSNPFTTNCRVVWTNFLDDGSCEIGLEFTQISEYDVRKIERFMELAREGLIAI